MPYDTAALVIRDHWLDGFAFQNLISYVNSQRRDRMAGCMLLLSELCGIIPGWRSVGEGGCSMKRDMDLVRAILMGLEASDGSVDASELITEEWPKDLVAYHFRIMDEAGLIESNISYADNQLFMAQAGSLTWEGHEYLDSIRSDKVWTRVKKELAKIGGSASLDVVKDLASTVGKKLLFDGLDI